VRGLTAHLVRAARLEQEIHRLGVQSALSSAGVDDLQIGLVVTDARGQIFWNNHRAEDLFRSADSVLVRGTALSGTPDSVAAQLHGLIRDAVRRSMCGRMRVQRGAGRAPLQVTVAPLPAASPLAAPWQEPLALVILTDPDRQSASPARQLKALFGLTTAESRLAAALATGHTPAEFALNAGLSENTVKTQLRSVLAKTGTRGQAELARLIGALPPIAEH